MIRQIDIKPLLKNDINYTLHLQPEGWNDIRKVFLRFFGHDFFYPVKAIYQEKIIGVGEVIFNKNSAWIGNVIVDKPLRNQGIGTYITEYLAKYIDSKNIKTQMLLATPLGQPVYEKLGFQHISVYVFLKREKPKVWNLDYDKIIDYAPKYQNQITALDQLAMGEDRSEILKHFTKEAKLFVDQGLQGFYLPHLGDGLVIANNNTAGFELLKVKWATREELIILPTENLEIIEFAKSQGFKAYRYAARMIKGKEFEWNPQMIYNRVGGYLG